jgi:hypothetical protein
LLSKTTILLSVTTISQEEFGDSGRSDSAVQHHPPLAGRTAAPREGASRDRFARRIPELD